MTVYFISGQAADEKLFENLVLPSHLNIQHVHWIEPFRKESLNNYCERLSKQIDTSNDFVLIGVSLGGIAAIELNRILQPKQTIIISTIATRGEMGPFLKFIRLFQIHKIVPPAFYKWHTSLLDWFFGVETKREKELLDMYARSATKNYMKWAVNEILNWKNNVRPPNLFHIHGTKDRIFPHQRTHADVKIEGGTHLMVHNRPGEISRLLAERINSSK